jgi:hypothetical protein
VAVLIVWAGFGVLAASVTTMNAARAGLRPSLFFFALLGIPVAALTLYLAWPLYRQLEARGHATWYSLAALGALCGGIVVPLVWRIFWGAISRQEFRDTSIIGLVAGAAAGLTLAWTMRGSRHATTPGKD